MLRHNALLNEQIEQWQDLGCTVAVANQNAFRLRGRTAILAGKPDLIVGCDDKVMIVEVKTGREQPGHAVQLRICK